MNKTTLWFKHDLHARNDSKLTKVNFELKLSGIGAYWCIVEMLYESQGILSRNYKLIAHELKTSEKLIKSLVENYDLFVFDGDFFWSKSAKKRLDSQSEKNQKCKDAVKERWDKVKISKLQNIEDDKLTF